MKTILLSIVMMGAALTADAQATVKVNFNKNDTTIYKGVFKVAIDLPMGQGSKSVTVTKNTRYVVLEGGKNDTTNKHRWKGRENIEFG